MGGGGGRVQCVMEKRKGKGKEGKERGEIGNERERLALALGPILDLPLSLI